MLQSQGLRAAYTSGGGNAASISYRANYRSTANATSYTFSSSDIGTATGRSIVVVAVHSWRSTSFSVSSVTIGGVSATNVGSAGTQPRTELWYAEGVSGTTGDIVVTMSATTERCLVGVYALYNLRSNTPNFSGTSSGLSSGLNRTVNTTVNGVIVGAASANASGRTYTWTGATENYDTVIESFNSYSAASGTTTSNTATTVSFTLAGGSTGLSYVLASWR